MTITITPEARRVLFDLAARNPARTAFRISYAGGCGALGYRMSAAAAPGPNEITIHVDDITLCLDYKSHHDLDGARIDVGSGTDDIVIVHDRAVVGGGC